MAVPVTSGRHCIFALKPLEFALLFTADHFLPAKRFTGTNSHETNISTQRTQKGPYPRFSSPHGHQGWQTGHQASARQGPCPTVGLIPATDRIVVLNQSGVSDLPVYSFPRKLRLTEAGQFNAVFKKATHKVSNRYFLILARYNQLDRGRLGLVVGKKHLPKAVQRNRVKRLIRTSFRQNQGLLAGLDIVILARSNMNSLDNRELTESIQQLWLDVVNKSKSGKNRNSTAPVNPTTSD